MNIAFIHYHLKTGGVTTVLKHQLEAIPDSWQTLVLTGHLPQTPFPAPVVHIPELAYSSQYKGQFDPEDVARTILEAIHTEFSGPCDVLHVHNPTLAKNHQFLKILKSLQKKEVNLLLQIHDFAEDGRPQAYFTETYPSDCHYGVINGRDYGILRHAGLKPRGLHLLANTVDRPRPKAPPSHPAKPLILYPVRAIRRKNIGEAILWSLYFKNAEILSITLPPNSAADKRSYEAWKTFVKNLDLKVEFERGLTFDFKTNVSSADSVMTTSIMEGFGFSFLEPWLYGKLLWGRKLPDICHDFEKKEIDLHHLYTRLLVPVDWIDLRQFKAEWIGCVHHVCGLFNYHVDDSRIRTAFDACTQDGRIDFGLLDEGAQKNIIAALSTSTNKREFLTTLNPCFSNFADVPDKSGLIRHNRRSIARHYDLKGYGKILRDVYTRVAQSSVSQKIDKKILMSAFLDLEKFSLLKWSDYPV